MKGFIGFCALLLAIFLSFPLQEILPPVAGFYGARILFVPMLFCYGALAFPFPAMLLLAIYAGLLTDLAYLHVVSGQVEIAAGWSIVYFVILGMFVHGFQPAYQRGHWWIHVVLSILATSLLLALQFVMISFRREGLAFGEVTAWRIMGSGLIAGICAPLLLLIAGQASAFFPEAPRTSLSRA